MITVLIPAHNEADNIEFAIRSLQAQTLVPDKIIVVADNCTDHTAVVARNTGADVFETVANTGKKAGALNQALSFILPTDGYVLVMDADTVMDEAFLAIAEAKLRSDMQLGAVGGVFYGDTGGGILGLLQRNEYARYGREIDRTGRVMVLTGTAALFRSEALGSVAQGRGTVLPGTNGDVYDTHALTEDNELTLSLKTLGWSLASPVECRVTTEIMPSVRMLWNQRLRWMRGAVENLRTFGFTKVTRRYWWQQLSMSIGVFALWLYLTMTAIAVFSGMDYTLNPFWLGITGIFVLERVATVWSQGWKARLFALTLLPEMIYDMFLQMVFVKAIYNAVTKREAKWHHALNQQRVGT